MFFQDLHDSNTELPLEVRGRLRELEHKIDDLEHKLQDMRNRRDEEHRWLERFCESNAPICMPPNEVLATIFENHPK
jgi:hypothetical protein